MRKIKPGWYLAQKICPPKNGMNSKVSPKIENKIFIKNF